MLKKYNNTKHSTTGFNPNEINDDNMHLVQFNLIKNLKKVKSYSKLNVGDKVRFLKVFDSTRKGFEPKYSKHVHTIERITNNQYFLDGLAHPYTRSSLLQVTGDVQSNSIGPDLENTLEGILKSERMRIKKSEDIEQSYANVQTIRKSTRTKKESNRNSDFLWE